MTKEIVLSEIKTLEQLVEKVGVHCSHYPDFENKLDLMVKIVKLAEEALGFVEYLAEATDADKKEIKLAKDLAKALKEWRKSNEKLCD